MLWLEAQDCETQRPVHVWGLSQVCFDGLLLEFMLNGAYCVCVCVYVRVCMCVHLSLRVHILACLPVVCMCVHACLCAHC